VSRRKEKRGPGLAHRALLALPPEKAHDVGVGLLKGAQLSPAGRFLLRRYAPRPEKRLRQTALGLVFANPVGLAAGFDKDGEIVGAMAELGFGWVEVGTVTPRPQPGNPGPRLFRYPEARSLENRMGFNNAGAAALDARLRRSWPAAVPVGVNLGKNKDTPNDEALRDYLVMMETFRQRCDYFVINVSSPNTPGLRDLQDRGFVREVLAAAVEVVDQPVLLKLAPDLETKKAVDLISSAVSSGAEGAILTNTTCDYTLLPAARGIGGLSGAVLRERSFEMLEAVAAELFGSCLLASVGGIDSGREAYRRLRAGAALVQIYTAMIYQGPGIVGNIIGELVECMNRDGFESIDAVIGADRTAP
jgi:dihydroorotate dehydrogenase